MSKKEYTSLFIEIDAFSSEDVLTASNVETGKDDDGHYAVGGFDNDWLNGF